MFPPSEKSEVTQTTMMNDAGSCGGKRRCVSAVDGGQLAVPQRAALFTHVLNSALFTTKIPTGVTKTKISTIKRITIQDKATISSLDCIAYRLSKFIKHGSH